MHSVILQLPLKKIRKRAIAKKLLDKLNGNFISNQLSRKRAGQEKSKNLPLYFFSNPYNVQHQK